MMSQPLKQNFDQRLLTDPATAPVAVFNRIVLELVGPHESRFSHDMAHICERMSQNQVKIKIADMIRSIFNYFKVKLI